MTRLPRKSSVVLWLIAPAVLLLSSVRPPNPGSSRAAQLPTEIADFELVHKKEITTNIERLLGTRDVAWWVFEDAAGNELYLTVVFHDYNWKSLHPPHICIRGSNFSINADDSVSGTLADGREISFGRILASRDNRPGQDYVSLYAFVGRDFISPSFFWGFYLNHFVPALFRQSTPGFLLRVEGFVGKDGQRATEQRLWRMFREFLPVGEKLIQSH